MSRSRRHGHRPHKISGVCSVKGSTFTTQEAALAAVARTPDAQRAYRGDCCGYWHITRQTIDEYAQRMAARYVPRRIMDLEDFDDTVVGEEDDEREQGADAGDAGPTQVQRIRQTSGSAPTPAEVARRIAGKRSAKES